MEDKRGYRQCVRIIITRRKQVLLGQKFIDGKFVGFEFPGGGIEEGDDFEDTVKKETLEEVGVVVINPRSLDYSSKVDMEFDKPERAKLYRGTQNHWYTAEYKKDDRRVHGSEGDALPYTWETIDNAIRKIKEGPKSEFNPPRLEALSIVKKMLDTSSKVSLESW